MMKAALHAAGRAYINRLTANDADSQIFTRTNERPVEYAFALRWLNRLQPQTVLDVGTGRSAWPALLRTCGFVVRAIDNVRDYWPAGMVNRHWAITDEDIRAPYNGTPFDVVTCLSVIEHVADPLPAIHGLRVRVKHDGHVILTTPYGPIGHPNVYMEPGSYGRDNPYLCRQHAPTDLAQWLACGFALVEAEYWRLFTDPLWSCGDLVRPLEQTPDPAHLGCFVLRAH